MASLNALLLDLDGTLIDSRHDLAASVNVALNAVGHPQQPMGRIVQKVGNGLRRLISDVMGPVDEPVLEKAIAAFRKHYIEHCADQTTLYENVAQVLSHVSKKVAVGIVTNKPKDFSDLILKKLGIDGFIQVVIGGDSLPKRKPAPDQLLEAMKQLSVNNKETLFVGDGKQDIVAGKAAQVKTCLVTYGYGFNEKTRLLEPDFEIKNFNEIEEILNDTVK